jgi:hypothetical protein
MSITSQKPACDNTRNVTNTLVPDDERVGALRDLFGILHFLFEPRVYDWMGYLSADYRGGYWHYYRLSNGGFYMAPADEKSFHIVNPCNGFGGDLSADGAGIAVCCFVLSNLCFEYQTNSVFADRFLQLRAYIFRHAEGADILRLID